MTRLANASHASAPKTSFGPSGSLESRMVQTMLEAADEGIRAAGDATPAARRLTEMRDFYGFMFRELPALIDRWHAQRDRPPS